VAELLEILAPYLKDHLTAAILFELLVLILVFWVVRGIGQYLLQWYQARTAAGSGVEETVRKYYDNLSERNQELSRKYGEVSEKLEASLQLCHDLRDKKGNLRNNFRIKYNQSLGEIRYAVQHHREGCDIEPCLLREHILDVVEGVRDDLDTQEEDKP